MPKFPRGTSYDNVDKRGLRWFTLAGLSNPERKACFLANISHESNGGAWLREDGWLSPVSALTYFVKTYAERPTIIPASILPRARAVLAAYRNDPKRNEGSQSLPQCRGDQSDRSLLCRARRVAGYAPSELPTAEQGTRPRLRGSAETTRAPRLGAGSE